MRYINIWFLIILTINVVLRFCAVWYLNEYNNPETWEYGGIAENIAAGNGFSWTFNDWLPLQKTSIQPPLYPYVMALFLFLFSNPYFMLEIFQVFISIIAGLFLYFSGEKLFNKTVGICVFAIYSIHPTFIYIPTQFLPLTFPFRLE